MKVEDLKFRVKGPPVQQKDIANAEISLGVQLPEDYKRFLLIHNGGRSKEYVCDKPFFYLSEWASVCSKEKEDPPTIRSLVHFNQDLEGEIPDGFLAIGVDVGSKHVVMHSEYFWIGRWDWETYDEIEKSFSSFSEFVSMLSESKDPIFDY